jgi:hypothetical protein
MDRDEAPSCRSDAGADGRVPRPPAMPLQDAEPADACEPPLAELCTAPLAEAQAICIKLESHGIPCELAKIADSTGDAGPEEFAKVLVHAAHLALARAAIVAPDEPDDPELVQVRNEQYISNWICPRCRQPGLDLLPARAGIRRLQRSWFALFALPFVVMAAEGLIPAESVWTPLNDLLWPWWPLTWMLTCFALACVVLGARRNKQCLKCGWELYPPPTAPHQ